MGKSYIIYDSTCPFCSRWVERIRRWDEMGCFEYVPNNSPGLLSRFPWLIGKDVKAVIWLVTEAGQTYTGSEAIYQIARRTPKLKPLAWLYKLPFSHRIADKVYRAVSKIRYKL
jgi:predicted DCC family thiol-disulfide oxidoreductase YuxK